MCSYSHYIQLLYSLFKWCTHVCVCVCVCAQVQGAACRRCMAWMCLMSPGGRRLCWSLHCRSSTASLRWGQWSPLFLPFLLILFSPLLNPPSILIKPCFSIQAQIKSYVDKKYLSPDVQGESPAIEPIRVEEAELTNKRSRHTCELCDKVIIGDLEWTGEPFDLFTTQGVCA